jgi:hypothetical protein
MEMGGHKMNLRWIWVIVIFFVVYGCGPANISPVIISLEANETLLPPSGETNIGCNATDIDGGNLSYNWSAGEGSIQIQDGGESVRWFAPDEPGDYNITVNVTDEDGDETTASTIITVRINHLPAIVNLIASEEKIIPLDSCRLECRAIDPDNDALTYDWEADGGNISGNGSEVNWTAPGNEGSYNITVLVGDVMGGKSTASLTIGVGVNRPPVIESLVAETTKVLKGKSCGIECDASDPDDDRLSYAWSTEDGSISGRGASVTWTAPSRGGQFTVMVTVSDGLDGIASREVRINVVTCACAL